MIKSFLHRGLKAFFETGSRAGIQPHHAGRLARQLALQLARLEIAKLSADMNVPGWGMDVLKGELAEHFAVTVNGNWRLACKFDGEDAVLVNYQDYH